jgi:hypothetical protein
MSLLAVGDRMNSGRSSIPDSHSLVYLVFASTLLLHFLVASQQIGGCTILNDGATGILHFVE